MDEIDGNTTAGVVWFRSRPGVRRLGDAGSQRERLSQKVEQDQTDHDIGGTGWLRGWLQRWL